jgi:phosphoribosyl 1,2-cyclic phosphate phosphodiesterase
LKQYSDQEGRVFCLCFLNSLILNNKSFSLKITFLGTGTSQGIPLIGCGCEVCTSTDTKDKRLRSSVMINSGKTNVVIDTGPDFRQQMLRENVKKLDAVVFTHEHKDHIAGLDEVRAFNFINGMIMPVFATERVQQAIKREFAYIFSGENYPGIPKIDLVTLDNSDFKVGELNFTPIDVLHYKLPVKAFRVGNFTYITDANFISEAEKNKVRGSEVIVINALRRSEHISHFTLEQAIDLAKDFGAGRTYFTHISHQMGTHAEVSKELPAGIELAYDGLEIELA